MAYNRISKIVGGHTVKIQKNKGMITLLYLAGFLTGILYANLVSKQYMSTGIFSSYFLEQYKAVEFIEEEYFFYILKNRMVGFLILILLGSTKIRKIAVMASVLWIGISSGILIVSSIIQLGAKGILLCLIGMTPHFIFYFLSYIVIIWYFFTYPASRWNTSKTIFTLVMIASGMVTEVFVNPILMKMFLSTL